MGNVDPSVLQEAKKANLRYVSDTNPGISRKGAGQGFIFYDKNGNKVVDPETVGRIDSLVIPPAWTNVWISPLANGHLQATGRDEKNRKQYLYHPEWNRICQETKFDKITSLAELLPSLRREVRARLAENGLSKEKILATVVWLLQKTYIRVGNEEYAKENNSFGLTTLRMRHVDVIGDRIQFEFKGKSGKMHSVDIAHPRVAKTIRKLGELPGYELFQYVDDTGNRRLVTSEDVNDYLKSITGEEMTAKDFRTWGGTVIGAEALYSAGNFTTKTEAKKNISHAVKQVSEQLGNTTTVCRSYYIHPTVIESYQKQLLVPHFEEVRAQKDKKPSELTQAEFATVTLIKEHS